jgi:hypothetical protein
MVQFGVEMRAWTTTNKKLAIIAAIAVGFIVVYVIVLEVLVGKSKTTVNAGEIVAAVESFCATHKPLPQTVTFSQLIAQGYLGSNMLEKFGASEVTVFLNADENHPQLFLMDALMPDGSHVVAMSDGSVQGFSKSRFQQMAPTNGGPATPGTNSGGSEMGRHRRVVTRGLHCCSYIRP